MEKIVSFCRSKGFVFQASGIYGGMNGFYDYGPLGVEMRKNIRDAWWRDMVQMREDVVGIDSAIIQHPRVWEASGHVGGFSDPMVDCRETKMRWRADQLLFAPVVLESGEEVGYVSVLESEKAEEEALEKAKKLQFQTKKTGKLRALALRPYTEALPEEFAKIPSPATGLPGSLTAPRQFNLMFSTSVGAVADESSVAYLRPETAQGIFINFQNIVDSCRVKIPFGIAQIGKSFRNEITPRNFIFRSREFEQMELEYFIAPDAPWEQMHAEWVQTRLDWHKSIGLKEEDLELDVHPKEKLAHYSKACTDIMFKFPFGKQELEGIAARGCFDLTQHQTFSGKSMEYFDEATKTRYIPHVIEPSVGVDRLFLALLCSAYEQDEIDGEPRTVLKLHPRIAPIKAAVFPLVKNKPELFAMAHQLCSRLKRRWNVFFDAAGAIGRRYRRMDEVGTAFCITVDFDSLSNNTFTLRDRDSTKQVRMTEAEIIDAVGERC